MWPVGITYRLKTCKLLYQPFSFQLIWKINFFKLVTKICIRIYINTFYNISGLFINEIQYVKKRHNFTVHNVEHCKYLPNSIYIDCHHSAMKYLTVLRMVTTFVYPCNFSQTYTDFGLGSARNIVETNSHHETGKKDFFVSLKYNVFDISFLLHSTLPNN